MSRWSNNHRKSNPGNHDKGMFTGDRDPTSRAAVFAVDGMPLSVMVRRYGMALRPMKLSRLMEAYAKVPLSRVPEDDRARILYHQLGTITAVANALGRSRPWVSAAVACDIA